jgi:hypothetical protein
MSRRRVPLHCGPSPARGLSIAPVNYHVDYTVADAAARVNRDIPSRSAGGGRMPTSHHTRGRLEACPRQRTPKLVSVSTLSDLVLAGRTPTTPTLNGSTYSSSGGWQLLADLAFRHDTRAVRVYPTRRRLRRGRSTLARPEANVSLPIRDFIRPGDQSRVEGAGHRGAFRSRHRSWTLPPRL